MFLFAGKYGLIGAVVSIAATLVFFVLDTDSPQFLNIVLVLAIVLWGQLAHRKVGVPPISYGETLGVGVLVVLWFGVITMVYSMIHMSFLDTGMIPRLLEQAEQAVRQQGLPEDQMEAALNMQKFLVGPVVTPIMALFSVMIIGTLLALVTSIFTRRSDTE